METRITQYSMETKVQLDKLCQYIHRYNYFKTIFIFVPVFGNTMELYIYILLLTNNHDNDVRVSFIRKCQQITFRISNRSIELKIYHTIMFDSSSMGISSAKTHTHSMIHTHITYTLTQPHL